MSQDNLPMPQANQAVAVSSDYLFDGMTPMILEQRHQAFLAIQNKLVELLKPDDTDANGKIRSGSGDFGWISDAMRRQGAPPSLWQSGAEKIAFYMGLVPRYAILPDSHIDRVKGNYHFCIQCDLLLGDRVFGSGLGTASTSEAKYTNLWKTEKEIQEDTLLAHLDISTLQKRESRYPGYPPQYNVGPHVGKHDYENTVLQIASKRAFVKAVRSRTGLSKIFADVDLPEQLFDGQPIDVETEDTKPDKPAKPSKADYKKGTATKKAESPSGPQSTMFDEPAGTVVEEWEKFRQTLNGMHCTDKGFDFALQVVLEKYGVANIAEITAKPNMFKAYCDGPVLTQLRAEGMVD